MRQERARCRREKEERERKREKERHRKSMTPFLARPAIGVDNC